MFKNGSTWLRKPKGEGEITIPLNEEMQVATGRETPEPSVGAAASAWERKAGSNSLAKVLATLRHQGFFASLSPSLCRHCLAQTELQNEDFQHAGQTETTKDSGSLKIYVRQSKTSTMVSELFYKNSKQRPIICPWFYLRRFNVSLGVL